MQSAETQHDDTGEDITYTKDGAEHQGHHGGAGCKHSIVIEDVGKMGRRRALTHAGFEC